MTANIAQTYYTNRCANVLCNRPLEWNGWVVVLPSEVRRYCDNHGVAEGIQYDCELMVYRAVMHGGRDRVRDWHVVCNATRAVHARKRQVRHARQRLDSRTLNLTAETILLAAPGRSQGGRNQRPVGHELECEYGYLIGPAEGRVCGRPGQGHEARRRSGQERSAAAVGQDGDPLDRVPDMGHRRLDGHLLGRAVATGRPQGVVNQRRRLRSWEQVKAIAGLGDGLAVTVGDGVLVGVGEAGPWADGTGAPQPTSAVQSSPRTRPEPDRPPRAGPVRIPGFGHGWLHPAT